MATSNSSCGAQKAFLSSSRDLSRFSSQDRIIWSLSPQCDSFLPLIHWNWQVDDKSLYFTIGRWRKQEEWNTNIAVFMKVVVIGLHSVPLHVFKLACYVNIHGDIEIFSKLLAITIFCPCSFVDGTKEALSYIQDSKTKSYCKTIRFLARRYF